MQGSFVSGNGRVRDTYATPVSGNGLIKMSPGTEKATQVEEVIHDQACRIDLQVNPSLRNNKGVEYAFKYLSGRGLVVVTHLGDHSFGRYEVPTEEAIELYAQLLTRGYART